MTLEHAIAVLLTLAVVIASARMLLGAYRNDAATRPRAWRVIALLSLQAIGAGLLYFALLPPSRPVEAGTMVVLTKNASDIDDAHAGEHVVELPEVDSTAAFSPPLARAASRGRSGGGASDFAADGSKAKAPLPDPPLRLRRKGGRKAGAERVPDLATALRRYPGATRLHIVGAGLTARDREAVQRRALTFAPAPLSRGIVELWWPDHVQAGSAVGVHGRVNDVAKGTAELLDPAGRRVDRVMLDQDGRFTLTGEARSAGPFAFRVRVRGADGAIVEQANLPLLASATARRRVLMLSGAPSPELKYLRRWATDAGLSPHAEIALGGGLRTGDAPVAFDAATLDQFDLVIIDERAWQSLGAAQYDALRAAVRNGLGMLLRITGPLSAQARARLRGLGLTADAAKVPETVRLAAPRQEVANSDSGGNDDGEAAADVPALTRRALRVDAVDGSPLLRDADGTALTVWRAEGRGRVAVWLLADTFRLVLAGHGERHARLWSDAAGVLMRARGGREPTLQGEARQGQRIVLCDIASGSMVEAPDGTRTPLLADPISGAAPPDQVRGVGCAGFWPTSAGWHRIRNGDDAWPFYIAARDALPGVQARALRDATAALVHTTSAPPSSTASAPGPRWPWFLAWLVVSALLWWLERARYGR